MAREIEYTELTDSEIYTIEIFINQEHEDFVNARNSSMLSLFLYNGLKTHDVISLNVENIDFKNHCIYTKDSKIDLNENTEKILLHYLSLRKDIIKPLFINNTIYKIHGSYKINKSKLRLNDRSIQRIVKDVIENQLNINKDIKPKDFRHRKGILLSIEGATHKEINKIMGNTAMWVIIDYNKKAKEIINNSIKFQQT